MTIFSSNQRPNLFRLWLLFSVPWLAFFAYQAWVAQANRAEIEQYSDQWLNTASQAQADYSRLKSLPDAQVVFQDEYELAQEMIAMDSKASDESADLLKQSLQAITLPLALLIPIIIKRFRQP